MTLARVVEFEQVSADRMAEMQREFAEGRGPQDVSAAELLVLHDPAAEKALVVLLFDSEEDYAAGDAALKAMPASETPGARTSVRRFEVAIRQVG